MAARKRSEDALPSSHVFITLSRGASHRTFMARSGLAYAILAALPLIVVWLVGSTVYIALHDTLVSSLMLRERDMQYGYEDRIAALRSQLERATSKQMMTQRSLETKVDELASREAELQVRSGIVAQLDRQVAGSSAPDVASFAPPLFGSPAQAALGAGPDAMVPRWPNAGDDHAEATSLSGRISAIATAFSTIANAQEDHLTQLGAKVAATKIRLRDALDTAGLTADRLLASEPKASGGPFVPLAQTDDATPFGRSTVGLQLSLSEVEHLKAAVSHVPFNKPLRGDPDVTSSFGPRVDPFLGRPAMHTGIDLREDTGTEVFATAPGRITFAGPASGYGLMIEVDHGAGLVTRYAHLSEIIATLGQSVKHGDIVGRVGATGRATGPHLHYETRIDGEAVDPMRFLTAGKQLFGNRGAL